MNEHIALINAVLLLMLMSLLIVYGLDMKIPYPHLVIRAFEKPYVRLSIYISMFFLAYYNPVVSIMVMMCVLALHLDMINLVTLSP